MSSQIEFLYNLNPKRIKFGLEQTKTFLNHCNCAQPKAKIIHVAGTNGKGSTCFALHKILTNLGYKTGLFTSPHINTFNERIRINDDLILDADIDQFIETYQDFIITHDLTFFEVNTVMAVDYFEKNQCEFIILETGMGGRLDSTNCFNPIMTAITNVSLDHQDYLGETIDEIIKEKCGIIKKDVPLFSIETDKYIFHKIYCEAIDMNAGKIFRFTTKSSAYKRMKKILGPNRSEYEYLNNALAYKIAEYILDENLKDQVSFLADNLWPGRLEYFDEQIILDVSHNEAGVSETLNHLKTKHKNKSFTILTAISSNKNYINIFKLFKNFTEDVYIYPLINSRINTSELIDDLKHNQINIKVFDHVQNRTELKHTFDTDFILIIGSHFLLEDFHKRYD